MDQSASSPPTCASSTRSATSRSLVDCLHSDAEVDGFLATVRDNEIATVRELTTPILALCPPPKNQATLADWRAMLFREYGPR